MLISSLPCVMARQCMTEDGADRSSEISRKNVLVRFHHVEKAGSALLADLRYTSSLVRNRQRASNNMMTMKSAAYRLNQATSLAFNRLP